MKKLVLALSLTVALLVGCIIGGVGAQLVVPPVQAGTNPQKWEYKCFKESSPSRIESKASQLGAVGFEVGAAALEHGGNGSSPIWCFKRRLP